MEGSPLLAAALGFAVLLGVASGRKFRDLDAFRLVLADYRLLPGWLLRPAALGVAAVEIALALAWLVAPWSSGIAGLAGIGTAVLLLLYAAAIAANLHRGRSWIDCGCGGGGSLSWVMVVRNAVLAVFAVAPSAIGSGPPTWTGLAVSVPIAAAGALLYLTTGALLDNHAAMAVPSESRT